MLHYTGVERNQETNQPVTSLKKLIRKLRWAGLDSEAEKLCHELECIAPEDCVPLECTETD